MRIFGKTNIGMRRNRNEDAFFCTKLSDKAVFAVVCDGMGGTSGGGVASSTAVKTISEHITESYSDEASSAYLSDLLINAIKKANRTVFDMAHGDAELHGMGTTVVAAIIRDSDLYLAHAGDSRAYIIPQNGLPRQVTTDHSLVQQLVESGQITEEEARRHPNKNLITRAVGVDTVIQVDYQELTLNAGDSLMICTDGLSNYLDPDKIKELFNQYRLPDIPDEMINYANDSGGADNITVVVTG